MKEKKEEEETINKKNSKEKDIKTNKDEILGIIYSLLTEFIWTLNSVSLKYITKNYRSIFKNKSFIFASRLSTLIISFILGKLKDGKIYSLSEFTPQIKRCILIRANLSFFSMCFWTIAVFYLRITTCQIISTLSPILIITFSVIFLKEKYHSRYAYGILFGIIGSITIVLNEKKIKANKKDSNIYEILIGIIAILINISLSGINSVSNKIMAKNKISIYTQMFYLGIFHCLYSFLWMLFTWDFDYTLGYFVLSSSQSILFFVANYFMFCSHKMIDLSKTSLFQYTKVVFVFILGLLILGEKTFLTDIIGSSIIVGFMSYHLLHPIK